jgi:hypothetical protein
MLMLDLHTTQMKIIFTTLPQKILHIAKLKTFQEIEVKNWSNTLSTKLLFKIFSNLNIFSLSFFPKHKTTTSSWTIVAIYIYIYIYYWTHIQFLSKSFQNRVANLACTHLFPLVSFKEKTYFVLSISSILLNEKG